MNYFKYSRAFIIFLFVILTFDFGIAGEFTLNTSRGEIKCFEKFTIIDPAPTWRETILELMVYRPGTVEPLYIRGSEITVSTNKGVSELAYPDPAPIWVKSPCDVTVISSEGTTIYYNPDFPPPKKIYKDERRVVIERGTRSRDVEMATPRVRPNLPQEDYVEEEGISVSIIPGEAEDESQYRSPWLIPLGDERPRKPPHGEWQIPAFKGERRKGSTPTGPPPEAFGTQPPPIPPEPRYLYPTRGGAIDQFGNFYPNSGPKAYIDLQRGGIVPHD